MQPLNDLYIIFQIRTWLKANFYVDSYYGIIIVNDRSIKSFIQKTCFLRRLSIKKAKNGHLSFNLSNSLFYQKTNGIFKTRNLIIFKKSGHSMCLLQKPCILGPKSAKKAQINAFFSGLFCPYLLNDWRYDKNEAIFCI